MKGLGLVLVLFLILGGFSPLQHGSAQSDPNSAAEFVRRINAWRLGEGHAPLRWNPILQLMAQDQADYLYGLAERPSGGLLHLDSLGRYPAQRALDSRYNWPPYSTNRVLVGEIAGIGGTDFIMNFWLTSAIHSEIALNSAYREIGVGLAPHQYGQIVIVVLGSQPNIWPVLYDPNSRTLYLSNEAGFNRPPITQIQLFDSAGRPLSETWQPWQARLPLPDHVQDRIFILTTDGSNQSIIEVNLNQDLLAPSISISPATPITIAEAIPSPTLIATATPSPTATATATPSPIMTEVASVANPIATQGTNPNFGVQPFEDSDEATLPPHLKIIYNANSLVIVNIANQRLNLSDLVLVSENGQQFALSRWQRVYPALPISTFPAQNCVQALALNQNASLPQDCNNRLALLTLSASEIFWTQAGFEVQLNGQTIGNCALGVGLCHLRLPS